MCGLVNVGPREPPPDRAVWKREPRDPAYRWAYWGHRAQGFAALLALTAWSPPAGGAALGLAFLAYQVMEWVAYRSHRDAWYRGEAPTPDSPSRDIADWMAGGWAGFAKGAALHLTGVHGAAMDALRIIGG